MKTIQIGFSHPKKFKPFAQLIMSLYGINYSHVFIRIYSNKYNRDLIYQASKMMLNFMSPKVFVEENTIIKEFKVELTDEQYIAMMQFAIDNVGKPYGTLEALGLGVVRIAELCGYSIKNPFKDGGETYVCSTLGGYILENYTSAIGLSQSPEDISPLTLYKYLSSIEESV